MSDLEKEIRGVVDKESDFDCDLCGQRYYEDEDVDSHEVYFDIPDNGEEFVNLDGLNDYITVYEGTIPLGIRGDLDFREQRELTEALSKVQTAKNTNELTSKQLSHSIEGILCSLEWREAYHNIQDGIHKARENRSKIQSIERKTHSISPIRFSIEVDLDVSPSSVICSYCKSEMKD